MRFVFWDTSFFHNLKGDGACDLSFGIRISSKILTGTGLRFVFWDTRFCKNLKGGRGLRFVFWDTNFLQTLRGSGLAIRLLGYEFLPNSLGDGACDLSFGIRVSAKILRGTGLAVRLLRYAFLPKS